MLLLTLFCQWQSAWLVRAFTTDPAVIAAGDGDRVRGGADRGAELRREAARPRPRDVDVGVEYLRIISWNFVGAGIVFVCSSLFQGLGNTWPSLLSSASRVLLFAVPAVWLSRQAGFRLVDLWHLSVATVVLQALLSLLLLRREFRVRLNALQSPAPASN